MKAIDERNVHSTVPFVARWDTIGVRAILHLITFNILERSKKTILNYRELLQVKLPRAKRLKRKCDVHILYYIIFMHTSKALFNSCIHVTVFSRKLYEANICGILPKSLAVPSPLTKVNTKL